MTGAGPARPELEPDLYARLGVDRAATDKDLAAAYRRAARRHHPDHGGSPEAFAAIEEAYRVLRLVDSRAAYDAGPDGVEVDEWDDLGWGVPADPPPPNPADGPDRGPVDPFRPRAWALPPTPTLADVRGTLSGSAEQRWGRAALVAAVPATVFTLVAAEVQPGEGEAMGVFLVTLVVLDVFAGFTALQPANARPSGATLFVAALATSALMLVLGSASLVLEPSFGAAFRVLGAVAVLSAGALATFGAGWVFLLRRRRRGDDAAAAEVHRLQRRRVLADDWNLVREALRVPGHRVGLVLERVDALRADHGVLLWDVQAQGRVVVLLSMPVEPGTWVVHDEAGVVFAVADHDCLASWCELLGVTVPELDLWSVGLA